MIRTLLSIVASVILIPSAGFADDLSKEIAAQFEPVAQEMPSGDSAAFMKIAAADSQFTDIMGRMGPWADRAKTVLALAKTPMLSVTVSSATAMGDSAQAIIRVKITGTGMDRLGEEGPLNMTVTYRTDWVKDGGAWKLKSAREVMFSGTANKRPLQLTTSKVEEEARKQFQPIYTAVADLYEKQDWAAAEKAIPEGFIVHDMEGVLLSRKELMDRIKAGAKVVTTPIVTLEPQQIALGGDKVTVIRVMKLFGGVKLPDGTMGRITYTQVARDVFAKVEKGWAPKSSDELFAEAAVNGIPVPLTAVSGR
jgi:hypothetical protein